MATTTTTMKNVAKYLLVLFQIPRLIVTQNLDTNCDFSLIPETATELIYRISKFPTDGYDVKENVEVKTYSYQPIPLYSKNVSLEVDDISLEFPTFVHFADVTVEDATEAYCSNDEIIEFFSNNKNNILVGKNVEETQNESINIKKICINTLTKAHILDKHLRLNNKKIISRSLEAFKRNRLPPNIDFADVATGVLYVHFVHVYKSYTHKNIPYFSPLYISLFFCFLFCSLSLSLLYK